MDYISRVFMFLRIWKSNTNMLDFTASKSVKTRHLLRLNVGSKAIPSQHRSNLPDVLSLGIKEVQFIMAIQQGCSFYYYYFTIAVNKWLEGSCYFLGTLYQPPGTMYMPLYHIQQSFCTTFYSRKRSRKECFSLYQKTRISFITCSRKCKVLLIITIEAWAETSSLLLLPFHFVSSGRQREGVNWFCHIDAAGCLQGPPIFWVNGPRTS